MSDKERLEEINRTSRYSELSKGNGEVVKRLMTIKREDYDWLIQQAERVEELEKENKWLDGGWDTEIKMREENDKRIQELERENQRYKQALELIYKDTFYESENDLVSPIHVIRKRAEKALEEKYEPIKTIRDTEKAG